LLEQASDTDVTGTCSADAGLVNSTFYTDFTTGSSAFNYWNTTAGTVSSTSLGAEFSIKEQGDAPTIESEFYIFFGYVEVNMRAANGTGIVSTLVIESDDLDEIDWVCHPFLYLLNHEPNNGNRNKSAPTIIRSRLITLARGTPPPTIVKRP
jgi:hypothetical protein